MSTDADTPSTGITERMNRLSVECFMLVGALQVVEGQHFILAGGADRFGFASFPGTMNATIAVRLIVPFTETNQEIPFDVVMLDEDGANVIPVPFRPTLAVGRPVELRRGEPQGVNFPLGFTGISVPRPGLYVIKLLHEGHTLAQTWFRAVPISVDEVMRRAQ
jgi:hypothetical protein